jgi:hypothetical protein
MKTRTTVSIQVASRLPTLRNRGIRSFRFKRNGDRDVLAIVAVVVEASGHLKLGGDATVWEIRHVGEIIGRLSF